MVPPLLYIKFAHQNRSTLEFNQTKICLDTCLVFVMPSKPGGLVVGIFWFQAPSSSDKKINWKRVTAENPRFSVKISSDFRAILRGQGVFPRRSAFGKSRRALPWLQNKLWQRSVAPLVEELRPRKCDLVRGPFLAFLGV